MAEPRPETVTNPDTDYERSDLSLRVIGLAAIAVLVLLALAPLTLRLLYTSLPTDVPRAPSLVPPPPRLQTDAPADLESFRAREDQALNSYGWVDRDKGIVHIPIHAAMQRLVAQGIDGFPKAAQ